MKERDFIDSGNASSTIKNYLQKLGVKPEILRRVAIAAYEAEINVTAHTRGGKVKANIHKDFIHLMFSDKGSGIKDIEQSMSPGFSTADKVMQEMGFGAGLGLPNIKRNSDMLHIMSGENQPTCLEIIIYFGEKILPDHGRSK
ncbi:MAG: ATP-binding protein [Candidatus Cloacimonetes bacterium]|nr:ATP-binding protein [Candidatus Cloacimonadota bacterium]